MMSGSGNHLQSRIDGTIDADDVEIGTGVVVEAGAHIAGKHGRARRVRLGDNCYVGRDVVVLAPEFVLGDYSKLHAGSFGHGDHPLRIGHNCWIGGATVLDSMGGLDIDDNVGIGSQSQLWTHIQFGDVLEGCRFKSQRYMHVQRDAWFVGHCLVSPVDVGERSMAMLGSVITRPMEPNHVYAGVPARDVTDKVGPQFAARRVGDKRRDLKALIVEFERANPGFKGALVMDAGDHDSDTTFFDVENRTYTKTRSAAEVLFLRQHTPLLKFVPKGGAAFVPAALGTAEEGDPQP